MRIDAFRDEFPVLERVVYMNAGTDGPIPLRGVRAAEEAIENELVRGRAGAVHFDRVKAGREGLRERIAAMLGCRTDEVALTRSATDGVNAALHALRLGKGDEVVTTDEEHPGVLAPLGLAKRRGVSVRVVPLDDLADAVGPQTKLIACSHVSWVTGRVADVDALKATGVPLLYDGAQGLGAIEVEVQALGCDFYAAAGQKWLCGPDASGYLYVRRDRCDELDAPWPGYMALAEHGDALSLEQAEGARRFDMGASPNGSVEWSTAACDLLGEVGIGRLAERATGLAAQLAATLAERGLVVAPRGPSTLVSWQSDDAKGDVERLAAADIVVRDLPGRGLVRASIGAWATEDELERLASAVA
jgi:selenocysteine lyase/cysteine desulfurase